MHLVAKLFELIELLFIHGSGLFAVDAKWEYASPDGRANRRGRPQIRTAPLLP
jgi:hypothetical protein